jgi:hypothetical protein
MNLVLSVVMLAALALVAGAVFLWRRGVRKQAGLMLLLAAVMVVNVLIWTVPDSGGRTLIEGGQAAPAAEGAG